MRKVANDPAGCATAVHLVYVNDTQPGIRRTKKGNGFSYRDDTGKPVSPEDMDRIRKLVIPPAWKKVWICNNPDGHLQVTGYDALGRKQYRYHTMWNEVRNQTKFSRLLLFAAKLPDVRKQVELHLSERGLTEDKVLATVISLMERTYIRIGNAGYEKLYGSYGLTTLKDQHVRISGDRIGFSFRGKKGVAHRISISNRRLARIVSQCRDIPGKELFQYYDEHGEIQAVDSGRVNDYIRRATGADFTAKDFRTWAGSLHALQALLSAGPASSVAGCKKRIVEALDYVSAKLGNTRTVCKKYYVHPFLFELYENNLLSQYCSGLKVVRSARHPLLEPHELLLMKILRKQAASAQHN